MPPALPQPLPIDIPPSREPVEPLVEGVKQAAAAIPHIWAVLAMALSLLFFGAALWAARRLPPSLVKERVLAIYALATTAFLALTFFIELDREFLSVAIAAELLAVAWVATKTQISSLRPIAGLLGIAFAVLLFPQILLLVQLSPTAFSASNGIFRQASRSSIIRASSSRCRLQCFSSPLIRCGAGLTVS